MNTEQFHNQAQPTASLLAPITSGSTSCTVSNPANFTDLDANQQFQMAIQDTPASLIELVTVTAISGAVLTIARGTSAISHIAGAACSQVVTAAQMQAMYPNGAIGSAAGPFVFDGTLPVMEINPVTPAPVTVNIKSESLVPFRVYVIADGSGAAAANNITLAPDFGTIGGVGQPSPASTYAINTNGGAARFYFNGTNCRLI